MKKSAEEKLTALRDAVKGGKSFADAAKDAGLESKAIGPITTSYRPTGDEAPASLFHDASMVDPGSIADVVMDPAAKSTQAFLIFVEKREVEKNPDANSRLDTEVANAVSQNRMRAFMSWMSEQNETAKIERLYKKPSN
ncbi:MAG: hypothetical protein QM755_04660 [Luteolibacter sp.]